MVKQHSVASCLASMYYKLLLRCDEYSFVYHTQLVKNTSVSLARTVNIHTANTDFIINPSKLFLETLTVQYHKKWFGVLQRNLIKNEDDFEPEIKSVLLFEPIKTYASL